MIHDKIIIIQSFLYMKNDKFIYLVRNPKLTLIQPTWSAYPGLLLIALTTFNCIVNGSVTKGALVCFVVTVH